ncbi:hypothetical protein BS47DRAFT_1399465 [Hydnum rufescens UP504]|uniref:Uncharacterized protein n=1 Tax=Hydnum rufescens UP504 TaxID=1448309 RepID=A0A9P6DM16_9AGAM|nr:hypothetical protein BS47DRAFT_1399465 [Hydnum rufescens UP504]
MIEAIQRTGHATEMGDDVTARPFHLMHQRRLLRVQRQARIRHARSPYELNRGHSWTIAICLASGPLIWAPLSEVSIHRHCFPAFLTLQTAVIGYLIDAYTIYRTTALAANVLRSILATGLLLFTPSLLVYPVTALEYEQDLSGPLHSQLHTQPHTQYPPQCSPSPLKRSADALFPAADRY